MAATPVATARGPLHAWIGVSDLAVEKVKELPSEVAKLQTRVASIPTQARAQVGVLKTLPTQVKAKADDLTSKATGVYTDLVARGEKVLARRNGTATTDELKKAASA